MPDHTGTSPHRGGSAVGPSPALLAAQRRLEQLRSARQAQGSRTGPVWSDQDWPGDRREPPAKPDATSARPPDSLTLYPDLAVAMLQAGQAAAGRIWLLLRHLDRAGQGWLALDQVMAELAAPKADLRVCGRRQLRNLLAQGQGLFWERDRGRLWLKSAAKVAIGLGLVRLSGRPVTLPLELLLQGIGQVRAHFYAAFHSGRPKGGPISRASLTAVTGVPARTQRVYDQAAGVERQANYAVGPRYSSGKLRERAWLHGRGAFIFIDRAGRRGAREKRFVAWRLPNSYTGCHQAAPRGKQRHLNRQIDLVNLRAQGNGLPANERSKTAVSLFHPHGQAAGKAYNRDGRHDAYWPQPGAGRRAAHIWQVIPGREPGGRLARK